MNSTPLIEYSSLGNRFALLVLETELNLTHCTPLWIQHPLSHHLLAHGLLILCRPLNPFPQAYIFNADGSYGGFSGNGARIVAHVLMQRKKSNTVHFHLGTKPVQAWKESDFIATAHPLGTLTRTELIQIPNQGEMLFHFIDTGNPHALFYDNRDSETFYKIAPSIIEHIAPEGINLSMVTPLPNNCHQLLTFERGVGKTPACSSAALALATSLAPLKQDISIKMPGGRLEARQEENHIILQATLPEEHHKVLLTPN